ncbi:MAG: hypothetical protein COA79_15435 [Planctomycetota bacterium]|nr:MAG: hypothetical protein COA79_15435 [Planctomycetota bacterium]
MPLSHKKSKAIRKLIKVRSPEEISKDLNIPLNDILEHLKSIGLLGSTNNNITNTLEQPRSYVFILIYSLLIFIAPLVCMGAEWYDFANLAQCIYTQSISFIFLILWFLDSYLNGKIIIKKSAIYLPILGLILWSGLSLTWATNVYEGLMIYSQWVACTIIFFVIYNSIKSKTHVSILFTAIALSAAYIVLIAIFQHKDAGFNMYPQVVSPSATFGNKNMMIHFVLISIPIFLYFFFIKVDNEFIIINIFAGLFFVLACNLIFFTQTRTGMLGLSIQVILATIILSIMFIAEGKETTKNYLTPMKGYISIGLFSLFALIFMVSNAEKATNEPESKSSTTQAEKKEVTLDETPKFNYLDRFLSIFRTSPEESWIYNRDLKDEDHTGIGDSKNMRKVQWRNTYEMAKTKKWTGFGLYNWQIHYGEYRRIYYNDPIYRPGMQLVRVHNDYLQIFADLGIPGVLLMLGLGVGIFYFGFHITLKTGVDHHLSIKAVFAMLSIIGVMISALTSFPFEKAVPVLMFYVMVAIIVALHDLAFPKENKEIKLSKSFAMAGIIVFIFGFIFLVYVQNRRAAADVYFKTAFDNLNQGDVNQVISSGKMALKKNPLRSKTNILLGYAYIKLGKYDLAIEELEKGLKYYPNDLNTLSQIGSIYSKKLTALVTNKKTTEKEVKETVAGAMKWFDYALSIRSDFYDVWNNIGFIRQKQYLFYRQKNPKLANSYLDKSKAAFDKAISVNPYETSAKLNKAGLLFSEKKYKECSLIYENVINKFINEYDTANKKWTLYKDSGKQRTNRKFMNLDQNYKAKLLRAITSLPKAVQNLTKSYTALNNWKGALSTLEYQEKELELRQIKINQDFLQAQNVQNQFKTFGKGRFGQNEKLALEDYNNKKLKMEKFKILLIDAKIEMKLKKGEILEKLANKDVKNKVSLIKQSLDTYKKALNELNKSDKFPQFKHYAHLQIAKNYLFYSKTISDKTRSIIDEHINKAKAIKANMILKNQSVMAVTKYLESQVNGKRNSLKK